MRTVILACVLICPVVAQPTHSMPGRPEFEVASVKPVASGSVFELVRSGRMRRVIDDAHVDFGSLSMAELLEAAFVIPGERIIGPSWIQDSRFDVAAKLPAGTSQAAVPDMLNCPARSPVAARRSLQAEQPHRAEGAAGLRSICW